MQHEFKIIDASEGGCISILSDLLSFPHLLKAENNSLFRQRCKYYGKMRRDFSLVLRGISFTMQNGGKECESPAAGDLRADGVCAWRRKRQRQEARAEKFRRMLHYCKLAGNYENRWPKSYDSNGVPFDGTLLQVLCKYHLLCAEFCNSAHNRSCVR